MTSSPNVPNMRVCAIDVGTNSTRYMIADLDRHARRITVLFQGMQMTRLGAGIGRDQNLRQENIAKTLEAVQHFYAYALSLAVSDFRLFGTAALREARNGKDFCQKVSNFTGFPLRIIDGQHEAKLIELAIAHSLNLQKKSFFGADVGGGSAQILEHVPGSPSLCTSLPLGAVRLTETFLHTDPPTDKEIQALLKYAQTALGKKPSGPARPLIGVGGTVTTLAAMVQRLKIYDHAKIHGSKITRPQWEEILNTVMKIPSSQRTGMPGLQKGREDILVAGILVLGAIAKHWGVEEITVSDRGILYGMLVEYLEEFCE